MKKKEALFGILLKVSELRIDIETAEKKIMRLFNYSIAKRTVCENCNEVEVAEQGDWCDRCLKDPLAYSQTER